MTKQTALLSSLTVIVSIAPSSYQAAIAPEGVNPDVSSRLNMTFYDPDTHSETVIGYVEQAESEPLRITDVAHVEYSTGEYTWVEFTVLADEDLLRKCDSLLKHRVSKKIKARTPPSLRVQGARRFGSEILRECEELFHDNGNALYGWSQVILRDTWDAEYKIFWSRKEANQPLKLTALRVLLDPEGRRSCLSIKPKFSVYRLHELLTRSEAVAHLPNEYKWGLSNRQLQSYSDYISPPGSNVSFDTWPMPLQE
ncbi:hypothetical protein FOZ62_027689, partial [Perkinsus olseni]